MASIKRLVMAEFPGLATDPDFEITSPPTTNYNCIAWAAGDDTSHWWPTPPHGPPLGGYYWPGGLPLVETVASLQAAYDREGYAPVPDGTLQSGVEKIAIYAKSDGTPTHAARQLENGIWTSKLGDEHDIQHSTPQGVEGDWYGSVVIYMGRDRRAGRPKPGRSDAFFA